LFGKLTVFEAITLAGGFTEVANPSKVKIIRQEEGEEVTLVVNIEKLTKKGDASQDVELKANDRVIVPRSFF
jgi:polysaccharide export outer membrane protein